MTEAPATILYASAKPEQSKAVSGVRRAVNKWLERIGPKGVENHFIKAHENILATLDSDQRKKIFAKELNSWRKIGKIAGVAATVIDAGLVGFGVSLTGRRWNDYYWSVDRYEQIEKKLTDWSKSKPLLNPAVTFLKELLPDMQRGGMVSKRLKYVTHGLASASSLGSLGILVTSGPGHWLAHLAASATETVGKMKAKSPSKK